MFAVTLALAFCGCTAAKKTSARKQTLSQKQNSTQQKTKQKTMAKQTSQAQTAHVVVVDPGHQGPSATGNETEPNGPGSSVMKACTVSGTTGRFTHIPEYQLNLDIGLALEKELKNRGYTVVMTRRNNETKISNKERANLATAHQGEIFVRIHANGVDDSSQNGAFVLVPSAKNPYVARLATSSRNLGQAIIDHYCAQTGFKNLGISERDDQTGMNWSSMPVTTIEMGFMTNASDDRAMADGSMREKMVRGIADGIDAYFGESQ